MESEAGVASGGLFRVFQADRRRQVDLRVSATALRHYFTFIEESNSALGGPADEEGAADGGRASQGDLDWPTQDPGQQTAHVAAVSRLRRAAVPLIDDQVLLAHDGTSVDQVLLAPDCASRERTGSGCGTTIPLALVIGFRGAR